MKNKMMVLIILVSLVGMFVPQNMVWGAENKIEVYLDNTLINFDVEPEILNGRTMVPIRGVFEAFDMKVSWDSELFKVTAKKENLEIELFIGSNITIVNGKNITIDTNPYIVDGRTMVPLRFIAESTGATVRWDSVTRTVFITTRNLDSKLAYKIVDTGQIECYDDKLVMSSYPSKGEDYYGQDAQHDGYQPNYTLSSDGKTVYDHVTGLTWQSSPNITNTIPVYEDKKTFEEAQRAADELNSIAYGGYTDWRLPTIKEMYSLILFSGKDLSGYTGTDTSVLTPFIDTNYFKFSYGDIEKDGRLLESQYYSTTTFINNPGDRGFQKEFGVNFADGRIKGYDIESPKGKFKFYVQCVRGNPSYGINDFVDNKDDTITDQATGLMWSKSDNGKALTWKDSLKWVETMNAENYLGHSDWRLPTIKELQSIVDYRNAPEFNGKPAIDTDYFQITSFINEQGEADYPYFWSSTTHASYINSSMDNIGNAAAYQTFGRALGYFVNRWIDVHGAGAQRSDPKSMNVSKYKLITVNGITGYSFGPQGDAVRGMNYIRLVRDL